MAMDGRGGEAIPRVYFARGGSLERGKRVRSECYDPPMSDRAGMPPWAFRFTTGLPLLALDLSWIGPRRVLAYGAIGATLERALGSAQVDVTLATSTADALRTLAWTTFDGVLVAPDAADGIALVKALKVGAPLDGANAEHVRLAALRQRVTPVFVLPLAGDEDYAVIVVAPSVAFLERRGAGFARARDHTVRLRAARWSEGAREVRAGRFVTLAF
jgi:hypothetical protein